MERLLALTGIWDEMRAAGFAALVDALLKNPDAPESAHLYHLPIPLHSSAELHDISPDARSMGAGYISVLAGNSAWQAPMTLVSKMKPAIIFPLSWIKYIGKQRPVTI